MKRRPKARAIVGERDANAVQVGYGLDERETQAMTLAWARHIEPDETAEDAVSLGGRDPRSRVRHLP